MTARVMGARLPLNVLVGSSILAVALTLTLKARAALPSGWRDLPPAGFVDLAEEQKAAGAPEPDLAVLAAHARDAWLLEATYVGSAPAAEVADVAVHGAAALTVEQKQALRQQLTGRVVNDADLARMPPAEFVRVLEGLNALEIPLTDKPAVTGAWMAAAGEDVWKAAGPDVSGQLVSGLFEPQSDRDKALKTAAVEHCWSTHLADPVFVQKGDLQSVLLQLSGVVEVIPEDQLKAWCERHFETVAGRGASEQTYAPWQLWTLDHLYDFARLAGEGQRNGSPAYAKAVLRCMAEHDFASADLPSMWMGAPLGSDETRDILRAELMDEQGQVRQGVVRVLSWAYLWTGEQASWQKELEQKAEQEGLSGDQRAGWLLARAYAEEAVSKPPQLTAGRRWAEQALAAAESEAVRLACTAHLAGRLTEAGEFAQAKGILDSTSGQFVSDGARADIQALTDAVVMAEGAHADRVARETAELETQRLEGEVAFLKRRLEEAKRHGLGDQAAAIQRSIDEAEQALTVRKAN